MKWTTLYRKKEGQVYYYSIRIRQYDANEDFNIAIEYGNLTLHNTLEHKGVTAINEEFAVIFASKVWNMRNDEGWKCAQELGINSANQAYGSTTSDNLEQLLQKLL